MTTWTRETAEAHVRNAVGDFNSVDALAAQRNAWEEIARDLLAERDAPQPAPKRYRLELNGKEYPAAGPMWQPRDGYVALAIEDNNTFYNIEVPREAVQEVRPPSIEDPVTLPMSLVDSYGDGIVISARLDDETPGEVQRIQHGDDVSGPVHLTVEQMRDAARALWQRANAVEGGAP